MWSGLRRVRTPTATSSAAPTLLSDCDLLRVCVATATVALPDALLWRVALALCHRPEPRVVTAGFHLEEPAGVAVDAEGRLYVSDGQLNAVLRYDTPDDARPTTVAGGSKGDGLHQLNSPQQLDVLDAPNAVYVADSINHRVVRWLPDAAEGEVVAGGNGKGAGLHQLAYPVDVRVLPAELDGAVYVADRFNGRVVRWSPGAAVGVAVVQAGRFISGLAFRADGSLLASAGRQHRVLLWPARAVAAGSSDAAGEGRLVGEQELFFPKGVAVDPDTQDILVVDSCYVKRWPAAVAAEGGAPDLPPTALVGHGPHPRHQPAAVCARFGAVFVADPRGVLMVA